MILVYFVIVVLEIFLWSISKKKMDEQPLNVDFDKIKIRLEQIIVKGLSKTDDAFVKRQFQSIYKAKTLVELFQETSRLKSRLYNLGCFSSIQAILDAGNS